MAFRLGEAVVRGEICNSRRYAVTGWLELRGLQRKIALDLTGDCHPDLAGRHFRFEARAAAVEPVPSVAPTDEEENAVLERLGLKGFAWQQIGPTGDMTADRKVRVADCPTEELYMRCKLGEPPPMEWKRCLYLEWYSQNGRVVIEMVDPVIEFVDAQGNPISGPEAATDPGLAYEDPPPADAGRLSITSIRLNEDGEYETRDETPLSEDVEGSEDPEDPYGLFPDHLQRQLDAQAFEADRAIPSGDDSSDVIRECELMDHLIEHGKGEPISTLFDGVFRLRSPDSLDDAEAEQEIKPLLARLAMVGIALHICEHYTPREAYRLLVEDICREQVAFRELRGTQWVQHFTTSDFCEECQAEFESDDHSA